jgi:hypothetical protein
MKKTREMLGTYSSIEKIRAELAWVNETRSKQVRLPSCALLQRSSLPAERIVSFEIVHSVSQGFVVTPRESNFVVRLAYPGEYQFRYEGVVSPDGKRMSGQWYNESSGGIVTDLNTPSLPPGFPTVYERRD